MVDILNDNTKFKILVNVDDYVKTNYVKNRYNTNYSDFSMSIY